MLHKKDFKVSDRSLKTESCLNVNRPCERDFLHAPKMWAVVQISLPLKKQEDSAAILYLRRLLGDGNVSNVARRLNESRFIGMTNKVFQERLFWI